jgi:predicted metalloprotease
MGRGVALGGGGIGVLILAAIVCLLGGDPRQLLEGGIPQQTQAPTTSNSVNQPADENRQFVAAVLGSTEDAWREILPQQKRVQYRAPVLTLFSGQVSSACGYASAATGPFYCPGDDRLYLDFEFFRELKNEFKAPGDFAQAYVISHEVAHHVQNLLGTMDRVQSQGRNNQLSVALELQADCYAGIWAKHAQAKGLVEAGDVDEAIRAAGAVGDDVIQRRTQGVVMPDSFTHGSAEQRQKAFAIGFQSGNMQQCDPFR